MMAMGIVSDNQFRNELTELKIPLYLPEILAAPKSAEIIELPKPGRKKGDVEVPNALRKLIGTESIESGRESALELAKNFNISPSSTSAYTNGSTSTASYDKQPNIDVIKNAKDRISRKARNRLTLALNHITEEKLAISKARELAGVAKDLSTVLINMEGNEQKRNDNSSPQILLYCPQFRTEESFQVVQVKE